MKDDAISRHGTSAWLENMGHPNLAKMVMDEKRFPSAEPDIVRCKDCKHYGRADKSRFFRGYDCLDGRIASIVPDKDFCSRAERRTDGGLNQQSGNEEHDY